MQSLKDAILKILTTGFCSKKMYYTYGVMGHLMTRMAYMPICIEEI